MLPVAMLCSRVLRARPSPGGRTLKPLIIMGSGFRVQGLGFRVPTNPHVEQAYVDAFIGKVFAWSNLI